MHFSEKDGMLHADWGCSLNKFIDELLDERDRRKGLAIAEFNGVTIIARIGDTIVDLQKQYDKASNAKENELKRNAEHYVDPTAYKAIKKADNDMEREKVRKLVGCLNRVCELAGFYIVGRIELVDEKTGKIWK